MEDSWTTNNDGRPRHCHWFTSLSSKAHLALTSHLAHACFILTFTLISLSPCAHVTMMSCLSLPCLTPPLPCSPINMALPQSNKSSGNPKNRADIDPVLVDTSIDWNSVGGLDSQIQAVKEMVLLPLLYPEVFERFKFTPPRGVLFHGPPGLSHPHTPPSLVPPSSS